MIQIRQIIPLVLLFTTVVFGQKIESKKINSSVLNFERSIWIYTPAQYEYNPEKKFEVVYVFDSQARHMFDLVHSTLQFIGGQEYSFIVVGIQSPYNEDPLQHRNIDMLPIVKTKEGIEKYGKYSGGADKFKNYIKSEVIPLVEAEYRTLPKRIAFGHSNGGTFISYCLLKDPNLFDAFISVSPNYGFDGGQFVERFSELKSMDITTEKFIYLSNSNESSSISEQWKDWAESRKKIVEILEDEKFKSKIHLETKDFSATENHGTTVPISAFYGLKSFINYQFRTGENVIKYYDSLSEQNLIKLTPENTNNFAYECAWNDKYKEALTIINWAIDKFPNETNLHDSQGEFHEKLGDLKSAQSSFQNAINTLSKKKNKMDKKEFEETMEYYKGNLKRVSK